MFKLSHAALVAISGVIWLAVGCFLLPQGLKLLLTSPSSDAEAPLLRLLAPYLGGAETTALLLIVLCLLVGRLKGNYVLRKSVQRSINRIVTFPNPTSIANIYSRGYYLLFGSMVLLGMSIKWLGLANDIRGVIDVAIGAALITGAMLYFRQAIALRKSPL